MTDKEILQKAFDIIFTLHHGQPIDALNFYHETDKFLQILYKAKESAS